MKCVCGHAQGTHFHGNQLASCAMCTCKLYKPQSALASAKPEALSMNLKLLDGLVGEYALAHPNREISRVTLIEFALWYQAKIDKAKQPAAGK